MFDQCTDNPCFPTLWEEVKEGAWVRPPREVVSEQKSKESFRFDQGQVRRGHEGKGPEGRPAITARAARMWLMVA